MEKAARAKAQAQHARARTAALLQFSAQMPTTDAAVAEAGEVVVEEVAHRWRSWPTEVRAHREKARAREAAARFTTATVVERAAERVIVEAIEAAIVAASGEALSNQRRDERGFPAAAA